MLPIRSDYIVWVMTYARVTLASVLLAASVLTACAPASEPDISATVTAMVATQVANEPPPTPTSTPTPRLVPDEAESALRNYLMGEVGSIPIASKREDISEDLKARDVTATYQGAGTWMIAGPGMNRQSSNVYQYSTGRWTLDEQSLRIAPLNSEAATLLEFLESWQRTQPTPTPSPTPIPSATPTPSPTPIPLTCETPGRVQVSEVAGTVPSDRSDLDISGRISNTCNKPVLIRVTGVVYRADGTTLASDSWSETRYSAKALAPGETRTVLIELPLRFNFYNYSNAYAVGIEVLVQNGDGSPLASPNVKTASIPLLKCADAQWVKSSDVSFKIEIWAYVSGRLTNTCDRALRAKATASVRDANGGILGSQTSEFEVGAGQSLVVTISVYGSGYEKAASANLDVVEKS